MAARGASLNPLTGFVRLAEWSSASADLSARCWPLLSRRSDRLTALAPDGAAAASLACAIAKSDRLTALAPDGALPMASSALSCACLCWRRPPPTVSARPSAAPTPPSLSAVPPLPPAPSASAAWTPSSNVIWRWPALAPPAAAAPSRLCMAWPILALELAVAIAAGGCACSCARRALSWPPGLPCFAPCWAGGLAEAEGALGSPARFHRRPQAAGPQSHQA